MRAALACVLALGVLAPGVAGCGWGDDGGDDERGGEDVDGDSGCPVAPGRVGELLGYEVVVADDKGGTASCRYVPAPIAADDHPGASVLVMARRLAEDGFTAALAAVESSAGPVQPFGPEVVDDADRGWIARVGRVVQVGAAEGLDLVLVTVADSLLDVEAAQDVAIELAGQALG